METIIYYFTGTGNNLYIAKRLKELLGNTDIKPIKALNNNHKISEEYKNVIFCVPSYYSHIPSYVENVLKEVVYQKQQRVYTIIGCGGNRGHSVEDIRELVKNAGKAVSGEYMIILPGSYILSYNAFPKFFIKLEYLFAERKLRKIAEQIKNERCVKLAKTGFFYKESDEPRLQKAIASYAETGKNFVVSEKCKGCTICTKVCPVGNIHMENGRPVFGDNCQLCMACIQWCPNRAIDYNHLAESRRRYHHDEVSLKEIMNNK